MNGRRRPRCERKGCALRAHLGLAYWFCCRFRCDGFSVDPTLPTELIALMAATGTMDGGVYVRADTGQPPEDEEGGS